MFKYIVKRVLYALLILFGVSLILYILVRCLPADFIDQNFASQQGQGTVSVEELNRIKALYGIGDNSFWGIIKGYFKWFGNFIRGDMGTSFKYNQPVAKVIGQYMWLSFFIAFIAIIFQFLIAIPLGVTAATHQYGVRDYIVTVCVMVGISLPSFFFAALLIKVFAVDLGWFPMQGLTDATQNVGEGNMFTYLLDNISHLILPIITLVIINVGGLMRYTRTNTLEVLNADYIRTARAKGLKEGKVIYKHAFRNTLIPLVTLLAGILPTLFSGAMMIEQVFALPGIGNLAYKAMIIGDVPFIMGYNMFLAMLSVLGTLLADITYVLVDPRVRLK